MQSRIKSTDLGRDAAADFCNDVLALPGMGAWACDLRTEILSWSPSVFDMFGLPSDKPVERHETIGMYAEPSRLLLERLRSEAIASGGTFSLEAQIIRSDAKERWIRIKAATKVRDGHPLTLYGLKEDITAERTRWEEQRQFSKYDALTGLANRAHYHAHFLDSIQGLEGSAAVGALALHRLDNLREINSRWGMAAGDACLVAFARRIRTAYPAEAFAARLGGREFAVLLNRDRWVRVSPVAVPPDLADAVLWRGSAIPLHVSVGLAFLSRPRTFEPEALHARAVSAMEMARRKPGDKLRVEALPLDAKDFRETDPFNLTRNFASLDRPPLSPREIEALRLIARGCTSAQIAQAMTVSEHTVRNFIRRIYLKMGVATRAEAVRLGLLQGLL